MWMVDMSAGSAQADQHQRIRGIRFPGKYLQGPDAINQLGCVCKEYGARAFCVLDHGIADMLRPIIYSAFDDHCELSLVSHDGDCTWAEIGNLAHQAKEFRCDCIVGLGGGKALDAAKAVADRLVSPCVVVPTIAASDAPCSALAIIYNEDGSLNRAHHLARNPDVVIADTNLIAAAPSRFLAAGIADGLATSIEANACRTSGANNTFGVLGISLAYEIADLCEKVLFEFGEQAIAECEESIPGIAIERVTEANILLSGLGFESCGVAAAHGIQDGLCELYETHSSLHGEKVAIGILAELKLQNASDQHFQRYEEFMGKLGLPTRLSHIGILDAKKEFLEKVATRACKKGDIIHNEPMSVTPEMVVGVLKQLA